MVYNYVVDGRGSGSIYWEGRERFSWITSNYAALTFCLIYVFAQDLIGYHAVRGNCEIAIQVCFMSTPACVPSSFFWRRCQPEKRGDDVAQTLTSI